MKLTCKTVGATKFEVEVEPSNTIKDVKTKIAESQGSDKYPADGTKLLHAGAVLKDEDTVEAKGLSENGFIVVFGPKKPKAAPAEPAAAAKKEEPKAASDAPAAAASDTPAAAAAAPAGDGAAAAASPAAGGGGATGAEAFAMGPELQASVKAIVDMGFPEDDVKRAMRAAFNNPDRAVEYLMTGIPEAAGIGAGGGTGAGTGATAATTGSEAAPAAAGTGTGAASTGAATGGAAPAGGGQTGPNAAPLDMWSGGGGGAGGGAAGAGAGGAGGLGGAGGAAGAQAMMQQMRENPQMMQQLMQQLQSGGGDVQQMLGQLMQQNPGLAQALASDPQGMLAALGGGGGGEGEMPPGAVQIELTQEEADAVGRLEALGFPRNACVQAYLACDKQEELAANYLLEHGMEED